MYVANDKVFEVIHIQLPMTQNEYTLDCKIGTSCKQAPNS